MASAAGSFSSIPWPRVLFLAAGEGILNRVMAQAAKGVSEVDRLTVWVLTDNYYDTNRPDVKNTKRYRSKSGKSIHAEHGISFYVETLVSGKASACMFRFGVDPVGVLNNIALLGIDVGKTNAFSLSHGHWDHYTTRFISSNSISPASPAALRSMSVWRPLLGDTRSVRRHGTHGSWATKKRRPRGSRAQGD